LIGFVRPWRNRAWAVGVVTMLAAAGASAEASTVAVGPTTSTPGWRVVKVVASHRHSEILNEIVATGPGDAWAAGDVCRPCAEGDGFFIPKMILEHWNGHVWSRIRPPASMIRNVKGVAFLRASSNRNVWIFVSNGGPDTVLRYNRTKWSKTVLPPITYPLRSFGYGAGPLVFGPDNVWKFAGIYAIHYAHHAWHRSRLPTAIRTNRAVDAVSADDIWALGRYGKKCGCHPGNRYVAMHWNGHVWRIVASLKSLTLPSAHRFTLGPVVAAGPKDFWILGNLLHAPFLLHWTGAAAGWKRIEIPAANSIYGVVQDGHRGLWLYVYHEDTTSTLDHYSAGTWTQYPLPTTPGGPDIYSMAWIPGTQSVWAVGPALSEGRYRGVILKYGR
jgi:hypothetical protein